MKIKNVTPKAHLCPYGACPAIYETDRNSFLVVGKKVTFSANVLQGKVSPDETVVEIPIGLLNDFSQSNEREPQNVGEKYTGGTQNQLNKGKIIWLNKSTS